MNAIDMGAFIAPKSDQINADDLIGGPLTITITGVSANEGNAEQPINIRFEDDNGKPFRPCLSMRRVMVNLWGPDTSKYVGRSMTLYRDPKVLWGGMQVGGIRISHMSHIESAQTMAVTASKGKRTPFTVKPLADAPKPQPSADLGEWARKFIANVGRAPSIEKLDTYAENVKDKLHDLSSAIPEAHADCMAAIDARRAALTDTPTEDDPFGDEGAEG